MLSGYRVFSRRFVKSFPALAIGFEMETELTVHALELRMPIAEEATPYKDRPEARRASCPRTRTGCGILDDRHPAKHERPLLFFSWRRGPAATLRRSREAGHTGVQRTGLVPRFPTAILATGVMMLAFHSLFCGLTLDTVTLGRREMKRMAYLAIPRHRSDRAASC